MVADQSFNYKLSYYIIRTIKHLLYIVSETIIQIICMMVLDRIVIFQFLGCLNISEIEQQLNKSTS